MLLLEACIYLGLLSQVEAIHLLEALEFTRGGLLDIPCGIESSGVPLTANFLKPFPGSFLLMNSVKPTLIIKIKNKL